MSWKNPQRFQRVCPLLVKSAHGWCCSVPAEKVRPFWGRALAWFGGALLVAYLVGATLVFAGYRVAGVDTIRWIQVAAPWHWPTIAQSRSEYYFRRAINAFGHGQMNEAFLSLTSAQQNSPQNYDATLLLAQIAMFQGNFDFSDAVFARLLAGSPQNAERTAITYHDALLALNRNERLAEHCLAMASQRGNRTAQWVRSLLLALQLGNNAATFIDKHHAELARLAPHAWQLIQAEAALQRADMATARRLLADPFNGPITPVYLLEQINMLLRIHQPAVADKLLAAYARFLPPLQGTLTRYRISSAAGDRSLAQLDFRAVLQLPLNAAALDVIAAALVEYPDRENFLLLDERLRTRPAEQAFINSGEIWAAALVCDAAPQAKFWAEHRPQEKYPAITRIDFSSADLNNSESVLSIVSAVPLPRDVIHALFSRFHPQDSVRPRR